MIRERLRMVVMVPLIGLDCVGNCLVGGSPRNTLSGEAWNHRNHRWWGWTHRWIDWAFSCPAIGQTDHCKVQAERERVHGSVWASWLHDWRKVGRA